MPESPDALRMISAIVRHAAHRRRPVTHSSLRNPALIALALLTLIWSYNWIVMKQVLEYCGPFTFSALRYSFGSIVLFAALMLRGESLRPPPLVDTALIGIAQTAGFQALVQ